MLTVSMLDPCFLMVAMRSYEVCADRYDGCAFHVHVRSEHSKFVRVCFPLDTPKIKGCLSASGAKVPWRGLLGAPCLAGCRRRYSQSTLQNVPYTHGVSFYYLALHPISPLTSPIPILSQYLGGKGGPFCVLLSWCFLQELRMESLCPRVEVFHLSEWTNIF